MSGYYFEEHQKMNQWWVWLIVGSSALLMLGLLTNAMITQLYYGEPAGNKPTSDTALVLLSVFAFLVMGLAIWMLASMRLETRIDKRNFYYRLKPFINNWRTISREVIESYKIRTYSFRGYGIRMGFDGVRTYNTAGNTGVEIHFNGKRILIGTQRPDELRNAFERMMNTDEE